MDYIKEYLIDGILLLIFIFSIIFYYKKGFVRSLLEFLSYFAASFVSGMYSSKAAEFILNKTDFFSGERAEENAELFSAVVLFILISAALKCIIYYIDKFFKLPVIKTANQLLGGVLGALCGVILVLAAVVLIKVFELSGNVRLTECIECSRLMKVSSDIVSKYYQLIIEFVQKRSKLL